MWIFVVENDVNGKLSENVNWFSLINLLFCFFFYIMIFLIIFFVYMFKFIKKKFVLF